MEAVENGQADGYREWLATSGEDSWTAWPGFEVLLGGPLPAHPDDAA
jgi:hypothetical protein